MSYIISYVAKPNASIPLYKYLRESIINNTLLQILILNKKKKMAIKIRSHLLLFLLFLFISSGFLHCFALEQVEAEVDEFELNEEDNNEKEWWNQQDPAQREYQQCQQRCQRQEQGQRQQQCRRTCERQFERRQQQSRQCQQQCQRRSPQERQECQRRCQQQSRRGIDNNLGARDNPYYFDLQSFRYKYQSPAGSFKILPKFTEEYPQLFEGIQNYRFAILEANPNTFVQPHFHDAESIHVVIQGRATYSLVCQEGRESFHVERGQVIRVPAGVLVYLSNPDNNQVLRIARLFQPVFTPGFFKEYFITETGNTGGSILRHFSPEVLQSSLNTPMQEIERLLQSQRLPAIGKAPRELLKELSQQASSSPKQFKESIRPFNLLRQQPAYSNNWGQFFEAHPRQHRLLEDVDVSVNIAQMKQGSIFVPHYNSRQTTIVLVTKGCIRFEMGCPHVSSMQREGREYGAEEIEEERYRGQQGQIQRIVAKACNGEAFLIPANHPVAYTAEEDAETVGFGMRALNNERNFLGGQDNLINKMEDAAKALTFGSQQVEHVKRVFRENPSESYFVGSQRRQEGGGRHGLSWILEFDGYLA